MHFRPVVAFLSCFLYVRVCVQSTNANKGNTFLLFILNRVWEREKTAQGGAPWPPTRPNFHHPSSCPHRHRSTGDRPLPPTFVWTLIYLTKTIWMSGFGCFQKHMHFIICICAHFNRATFSPISEYWYNKWYKHLWQYDVLLQKKRCPIYQSYTHSNY